MYGHAIAALGAALAVEPMLITAPPIASMPTKLSVGDKAHRAFNETRLYKPNGAREVARRLRQSAA